MIQTIKQNLTFKEAVSRYLPETAFIPKGRKTWMCCPLHHDKTPSFLINTDNNTGHCFGCNWHGDFLDLLSAAWGQPLAETIKTVAQDLGLEKTTNNKPPKPSDSFKTLIALSLLTKRIRNQLKIATVNDIADESFAEKLQQLSQAEILLSQWDTPSHMPPSLMQKINQLLQGGRS